MGAQKDDAAGAGADDDAPMPADEPHPWSSFFGPGGRVDSGLAGNERRAVGKAARKDAPRSSHAEIASRAGRRDPIDLLRERGVHRDQQILATQYGRMLVSPFAYFRGSNQPMTSDLSETPRSGFTAQICGDASISNFGVFRTLGGTHVFDVADFAETSDGPWEWDLKRLSASVEISGRDSDFSRDDRREIVLGAARSYRETMRQFAEMASFEVWNSHLDAGALTARFRSLLSTDKTPSGWHLVRRAGAEEMHPGPDGLIELVDGRPRITDGHPSLLPIRSEWAGGTEESARARLGGIVRSYVETLQPQTRRLLVEYSIADAARMAFGVSGAVTDSWLVVLADEPSGDPIHLEIKRVGASSTERFWWKREFPSHGQRVVHGQKLIQATEDAFLGWDSDPKKDRGCDHYVRRFPDWVESSDAEGMTPASAELWARLCGYALARAHARSGDRMAIASYLGKSDTFDRSMAKFSRHYADQNERDYEALRRAVRRGRLVAERQ